MPPLLIKPLHPNNLEPQNWVNPYPVPSNPNAVEPQPPTLENPQHSRHPPLLSGRRCFHHNASSGLPATSHLSTYGGGAGGIEALQSATTQSIQHWESGRT